ncbi:AI-2E family transporter [Marinobacter bohaiensis]|uniref:AI-2E family transporter n=1 Tax=Marinobacter bohaiensis TaxID=2201898 RepID=UPI000DAD6D31|nr:AI-2E family transporter [Marinobacter bohaiensis]
MSTDTGVIRKILSHDGLDLLIRFGLIVVLVVLCDRIMGPFWSILIWALILAIALYPLHQRLARRMGGRDGRAATVLVLGLVLILGIPAAGLTTSFVNGVFEVRDRVENDALAIPPPEESVADWPVVGERVYASWQFAATDTAGFIESLQPHFGEVARKVVAGARSAVGAAFLFLGALIIAGIMMGYGKSGHNAMERIFLRLAGDNGPGILTLCIATVRSVAVGVLGVAFIQSVLLGVGFMFAGVPAAGLLAIITLMLGILQIPAAVVFLPVVAWMWMGSDNSVVVNVVFTVYLFIAGLSDNVLKPLLLGRGVDAPMPVILMGALGGMFTAGFIGLFIGAVGLAVGYQLFMAWVDRGLARRDLEKTPPAP